MNLSTILSKLRQDAGLSQEKLAAELGVSRQAVQKWESGAAQPDLYNAIQLSKFFGVSLDTLVFDSDRRDAEELAIDRKFSPEYSTMHTWEVYSSQLMTEYEQSIEEGKDIEQYRDLFSSVARLPVGDAKERIADVIFDLVRNAPQREDFAYVEPSALESIRACRPENRPGFSTPDKAALKAKLLGAWMGRTCGCLLGKCIEGIRTRDLIPLLKASGNYPMHRYILSTDVTEEIQANCGFRFAGRAFADKLAGHAPVDDDTNYTVLAAVLVDKYGVDFTPWDVSRVWLDYQPKKEYCTAERVAYRNFVAGYTPPSSAEYKNPYREWIGAQIRADYFGYINPGNPELAAEMAWRDASISHVKNGIYGEMFVAAMLAAAAVTDDIHEIIEAGLGQVPENSRLTDYVRSVMKLYADGADMDAARAHIHAAYDENSGHGWCHTISNAMIVTAALLWGEGDYAKSICLAVETCFDTDCNGATVGSIIGMRGGIDAIPEEWTAPTCGKLATGIFGVGVVGIEEMAERTYKIAVR